jgi:saccharopine dehydrogenase-like NADP-dependent oxidoreductase
LDVTSEDLDKEVGQHDVVVSLVPFVHHLTIIETAMRYKTDVVTTSYVSPAIRALEATARAAGVVLVNEVGVDPGIDHLYAVKTIGEVHSKGGKVSV